MTKVRAGDGVLIAGEKRLVVHFMIQPNFVSDLLGDPVLRQQGFLSRLLIAWPRSRIGFRADESDDDQERLQRRPRKSSDVASMRWCPATARTSSSSARRFGLTLEARKLWRAYSNEIERAQQPGALYAELSEVAGKSAEMAGRLAGVLTLYEKPGATTVTAKVMTNAITVARWYLNEALRIAETGMLRPDIVDAIELLEWLQSQPATSHAIGLLLYGPNRMRGKAQTRPDPSRPRRSQPHRAAEERTDPCPRCELAKLAGVAGGSVLHSAG